MINDGEECVLASNWTVDGVLRFAYDIDLTAFIGRKAHDEES
jgi:hypothetical protein